MITTPHTRLADPIDTLGAAARFVTSAQVDQAVMQLRERPGQTPVEQVQAVLRALDLTVVPTPVASAER